MLSTLGTYSMKVDMSIELIKLLPTLVYSITITRFLRLTDMLYFQLIFNISSDIKMTQ